MDIDAEDDEEEGGAGWIMTFADLMSLLMCFFVLLLSFSEMDILKYKQVAGSMKDAFGIQRKVKSDVIPKGTSMVTDKFSPGKPNPDVLINEMRQDTTDELKDNLDANTEELSEQAQDLAELLKIVLQREIGDGVLDVIVEGNNVSIRIRERDSFPSGSADLEDEFFPILGRISEVLNESAGQIIVGGHTDSVPISTREFPSNWVLSAARATTVVHYLVDGRLDDVSRIQIRAYADTKPVVTVGEIKDVLAKNRRIEIVVKFDGKTGHKNATMGDMLGTDGL